MSDASEHLNQQLVEALLNQQRRELRWKKWRFFLMVLLGLAFFVLYAGLMLGLTGGSKPADGEPYVALVRVEGEIGPGKDASALQINPLLTEAFEDRQAKGVVVLINSPGGTPVQASLIRERMLQLRKQYPKTRLVVVAEDMLTSGAYLIATGAEQIYVNRSTLTGSIGVIMRGFGFVDAAKKLGIERRVYTAGSNKNRLDPFVETETEDLTKVRDLLNKVHHHFIESVEQGRGDRLKGDKQQLFSGDFWTGEEAVELGLVDGIRDLTTTLQQDFAVKSVREYQPKRSVFEQFSRTLGAELRQALDIQTLAEVGPLATKLLP